MNAPKPVPLDVQALFDEVMRQKPSDRLRLAAMLLDTDPTKAKMAADIARTVVIELDRARFAAAQKAREEGK